MSEETQEHYEPKHSAVIDNMTPYQRFVHKILLRIVELSTLELIVATLHLSLTALAIFGYIGASGGGEH